VVTESSPTIPIATIILYVMKVGSGRAERRPWITVQSWRFGHIAALLKSLAMQGLRPFHDSYLLARLHEPILRMQNHSRSRNKVLSLVPGLTDPRTLLVF